MKAQIEEKENISYNISMNAKENEYKEIIINDLESKIKVLKERNNYYQNTLNEYTQNIKNYEKEIEILKKNQKEKKLELSITKNNFNLIMNKNKSKNKLKYSSDNYDILCDKNFNNFHWFLLKNKKDGNDDINNFIWAEKNSLENLDTFNSYKTEVEEENKKIIQNISKLEEKDDIISKLTYKIRQLEKQNNTSEDFKSTSGNSVPLDKFNKLLIQLNELEEKFNILQKENLTLKKNKKNKKKKEKKDKKNNENNDSTDNNMKDYINKSIKIKDFVKNQKESNNLIMDNEDLKNIENILEKNLNSKDDDNINDDSMNINYDQSSLENSENNNNKKYNEDKIDENEDESNEESGEISDNENGDDDNEDDNELKKELNQTKYQLDYIRNLYRDIEKRFNNIKKAIKKLFIEIKIPEKENDIKDILKLCEFKDDEILEIINRK